MLRNLDTNLEIRKGEIVPSKGQRRISVLGFFHVARGKFGAIELSRGLRLAVRLS